MTETEFDKIHHRLVTAWGHPHCNSRGGMYEYRLEVEKIIGRYLTPKEVVHHHYNWDGSATLVLCPDVYYHRLLHTREEALRYCGHANWKKCDHCTKYDDPNNLSIGKNNTYHKSCHADYCWEYRQRRASR